MRKFKQVLHKSFLIVTFGKMFVSGDAEGPWPSGKLQLFELERSLLHSGCMLGYNKCSGAAMTARRHYNAGSIQYAVDIA